MSMQPTDRWLAAARGTPHQVISYAERVGAKRLPDVRTYLIELHRLCLLFGFDYALLVGHSAVETGDPRRGLGWLSDAWEEWLNPVGLGITDGGLDIRPYRDGIEAARAHVTHLLAYLDRDAEMSADVRTFVEDHTHLDPRYDDIPAAWRGSVRTLADLQGKWWTNPGGTAAIVARGNAIFPGIPDQEDSTMVQIPNHHSVTQPPIYHLAADYARFGLESWQAQDILNSCFWNRNGGEGDFLFYHIQDGWTRGSLDYWGSDDVDASSTVMAQIDGSLLYIIPREHGPWTNGDVNRPTWQASEVLARGGNPNNWSLTCEAAGVGPLSVLPRKQVDAIVWWTQDEIMRNPGILDSEWCMLGHWAINSVSRPGCGLYYQQIVDPINTWLEGAVVLPPEPPVVEPTPLFPPGMTFELARELYELRGKFTASWTSKEIGFDLDRSECRWWLESRKARLTPGDRYDAIDWPALDGIIRRGKTKNVHAYVYGGEVYEKVIRGI